MLNSWAGNSRLVHVNIRARFAADEWRALQDCVVLVCREPPFGATQIDWRALDQSLGDLAKEVAIAPPPADLAFAILAELSADELRQRVFTHVRSMVAEKSEKALRDITTQTARMVDRVWPEQGFVFRSTMILVSMQVADEMSAAPLSSRH